MNPCAKTHADYTNIHIKESKRITAFFVSRNSLVGHYTRLNVNTHWCTCMGEEDTSISKTVDKETMLMLHLLVVIVTEVTLMVNIMLKRYSTNFKSKCQFPSHA